MYYDAEVWLSLACDGTGNGTGDSDYRANGDWSASRVMPAEVPQEFVRAELSSMHCAMHFARVRVCCSTALRHRRHIAGNWKPGLSVFCDIIVYAAMLLVFRHWRAWCQHWVYLLQCLCSYSNVRYHCPFCIYSSFWSTNYFLCIKLQINVVAHTKLLLAVYFSALKLTETKKYWKCLKISSRLLKKSWKVPE